MKKLLLCLILTITISASFSQTVIRGAYLQTGTQTSVKIHWRTNVNSNSRVRVGTSYLATGLYPTIIDNASSVTEHIINVTGLSADTKYYYSIGTSATVLQVSTDNYFTTLPGANPGRKLKFAAFGDCGKNDATYQSQTFSQYQTFIATNGTPDAWLLLGDNAYNAGTDAEYTSNFFGTYGATILKNHKLYPSPGNHDYANSATNQDVHSNCPYYSIFDLPTAAECGGFASGKEEFYSYDIGNVHFLALDAYGEESNLRLYDTTGAQAVWVKQDLAANTKKWTVAYWHHPPYTMGSHNSDTEGELINMRQKFITILERFGVDLVINGHSHDYERSYLIKGHYGLEATFNPAIHAVSTSSAKYTDNTSCPYVYNSAPANHGTVYVVAGSTGASGVTQGGYPHDAFPYSVNDGGFFYFEVDDNRLDAKFIRRDGTTFDNFTIMKDVNKTTNYAILNGSSQTLTASWPQSGSYTWTASVGTTQSVSVSPPNNAITNYTVTDAFGCVSDAFSVTTSSTLPVTLLTYDVTLTDKKVIVKWSTATETNNRSFTIERSATGRDFNAIGTVNGSGNSSGVQSYTFVDAFPLSGRSYYRLLQSDFDDNKEYFGIKRIDNNTGRDFEAKTVSSYNNKLVLQINSSVQGLYQLNVYDVSGRKWKNETLHLNPGTTQKEINLSKGVFIWEIRNEKGDAVLQKVIIQ
jgi:acid phosphatase type 7